MSNTNTGGPAFPGEQQAILINSEHRDIAKQYKYHCNGMTLRDYFAAKAMPELIGFGSSENGAKIAYQWADAMLKARAA